MKRRKTAGELSHKASKDNTKYDAMELAMASHDDVHSQLLKCAEIHSDHDRFKDLTEFCVGLYIASDPLIRNVRRHKYCAFPWLPEPRPHQAMFLFRKSTQKLHLLWCLPSPLDMATLSEMPYVDAKWERTKGWCDAFYQKKFWEHIRSQSGISMLSQEEYLNANCPEIIQARSNQVKGSVADTFDFSKISVKKVVDEFKPVL